MEESRACLLHKHNLGKQLDTDHTVTGARFYY